MEGDEYLQFKSSDLYLSAYVAALGLKLRRVDRSNPRRCVFVFDGRPDPEDVVACAEGRATVNAQAYARAVRHLKYRLYHESEGLPG